MVSVAQDNCVSRSDKAQFQYMGCMQNTISGCSGQYRAVLLFPVRNGRSEMAWSMQHSVAGILMQSVMKWFEHMKKKNLEKKTSHLHAPSTVRTVQKKLVSIHQSPDKQFSAASGHHLSSARQGFPPLMLQQTALSVKVCSANPTQCASVFCF